MADVINLHAAKTQLSRLVDRAAAGEEIIIARAGRPVARLGPLSAERLRRTPGLLKGLIVMSEDFDEPLSEEELRSFSDGPIFPARDR